jgi:hypothetical protein
MDVPETRELTYFIAVAKVLLQLADMRARVADIGGRIVREIPENDSSAFSASACSCRTELTGTG